MINKPSLLQRARLALQVFQKGMPGSRYSIVPRDQKSLPFIWPDFRSGQPQWQLIDLNSYIEEGFDANTLIYSAIMYKARSSQAVKLRAYKGDPDHPDLLPARHPLAQLVARPNPSQSWAEFQAIQTVFLNLAGNAYTWMIRPRGGGLPEEMYPVNPLRVFIVPAPQGRRKEVLGFLYVPEGKSYTEGIPILPQDMSHVKLPNPGDNLDGMGYGLSPLSPLARSADVDNMITKFLQMFFEQGVMVPGVLEFEVPIDDEIAARIKERWREMYGGYENWKDIGILDHGAKYNRIGLTFDEMGFETLDERNESRILGPFGVPPILIGSRLGLMRSTYANYEEARKAFWEDTFTAELGLFEADYQYYLQSDDGGFVNFDYSGVPALRKNLPALLDTFVKAVAGGGGLSKYKAAELLGLDVGDLPDGDTIYMPINLIPVGQVGKPLPEPAAPAPAEKPPAEDTNQGAVEAEEEADQEEAQKALKVPAPSSNKAGFTPEQKAAHWKAVDTIARSWEARFASAAREALENDKRELLALVTAAKDKAKARKATVDWKDYLVRAEAYLKGDALENWRKIFSPVIRGVVTAQGERWAGDLGMAFDVENLFARSWFNSYTLKFAQPIAKTTADIIAQVVDMGIADGWSIPTMQGHLTTVFQQMAFGDVTPDDLEWFTDRMPPYRTEMIARTETIRASNAGTQELFTVWGVQKKEWLATRDNRVRDEHLDADGQVVANDEPFNVGGESLMYPGDPSGSPENTINCRCTELPVLENI